VFGLGVEGDVELAQFFVALEVEAHAAKCHFLFGFGELQAVDLLGVLRHVLTEAQPRRRRAGRVMPPEVSRQPPRRLVRL
jgi:hypothetical protein